MSTNGVKTIEKLPSQFHYGSIQIQPTEEQKKELDVSLNSTMVRFKSSQFSYFFFIIWSVSIPLWFDSNKNVIDGRNLCQRCLNSTMVRFKLIMLNNYVVVYNGLNSTMVRFKLGKRLLQK